MPALTCACGAVVHVELAPGAAVPCHACGAAVRAPVGVPQGGIEFTCPACNAQTRALAAPGKRTKCKRCGERVRVPLNKASEERVVCPACAAETSTSAGPGRPTACRACGERFRVPLRDPAAARQATEASTPPLVRRGCPACGEKVDGRVLRCSACNAVMDEVLHAERYAPATEQHQVFQETFGSLGGRSKRPSQAETDANRSAFLAKARSERESDERPLAERYAGNRFPLHTFFAGLAAIVAGVAWGVQLGPEAGHGPKAIAGFGMCLVAWAISSPKR